MLFCDLQKILFEQARRTGSIIHELSQQGTGKQTRLLYEMAEKHTNIWKANKHWTVTEVNYSHWPAWPNEQGRRWNTRKRWLPRHIPAGRRGKQFVTHTESHFQCLQQQQYCIYHEIVFKTDRGRLDERKESTWEQKEYRNHANEQKPPVLHAVYA